MAAAAPTASHPSTLLLSTEDLPELIYSPAPSPPEPSPPEPSEENLAPLSMYLLRRPRMPPTLFSILLSAAAPRSQQRGMTARSYRSPHPRPVHRSALACKSRAPPPSPWLLCGAQMLNTSTDLNRRMPMHEHCVRSQSQLPPPRRCLASLWSWVPPCTPRKSCRSMSSASPVHGTPSPLPSLASPAATGTQMHSSSRSRQSACTRGPAVSVHCDCGRPRLRRLLSRERTNLPHRGVLPPLPNPTPSPAPITAITRHRHSPPTRSHPRTRRRYPPSPSCGA